MANIMNLEQMQIARDHQMRGLRMQSTLIPIKEDPTKLPAQQDEALSSPIKQSTPIPIKEDPTKLPSQQDVALSSSIKPQLKILQQTSEADQQRELWRKNLVQRMIIFEEHREIMVQHLRNQEKLLVKEIMSTDTPHYRILKQNEQQSQPRKMTSQQIREFNKQFKLFQERRDQRMTELRNHKRKVMQDLSIQKQQLVQEIERWTTAERSNAISAAIMPQFSVTEFIKVLRMKEDDAIAKMNSRYAQGLENLEKP